MYIIFIIDMDIKINIGRFEDENIYLNVIYEESVLKSIRRRAGE